MKPYKNLFRAPKFTATKTSQKYIVPSVNTFPSLHTKIHCMRFCYI